MNLVLDIGNTRCKAAVFNQNEMVEVMQQNVFTDDYIEEIIKKYNIKKGVYASVRTEKEIKVLTKYNFLELSHLTPIPLENKYKTPDTLGKDRIAGVVGAFAEHKNQNVLIIDMGTCITFDFVTAKNEYLGGAISPGFEMRLKALNILTGKLPKVEYDNTQPNLIGDSTKNSILSGVYNGLKNELQGVINQYISQYDNLKVVVTGGDYKLFDLEPKNRIFADKFLVLKGLNEILNYNAEK